jgi:hypothetical protein
MGVAGVRVVPGSGNAVRRAGSGGCSLGFRGRCVGGALRARTRGLGLTANRANRFACSALVRLLNPAYGRPASTLRGFFAVTTGIVTRAWRSPASLARWGGPSRL